MLDSVSSLASLAATPGKPAGSAKGRQAGRYSIRITRQWRLCFNREAGHAWNVEVVDYH